MFMPLIVILGPYIPSFRLCFLYNLVVTNSFTMVCDRFILVFDVLNKLLFSLDNLNSLNTDNIHVL